MQFTSARQTVWQRYTAMLLANSIFFGLVVRSETEQQILGAVAGIALCCVWLAMLWTDWMLFRNRLLKASRFHWTHLEPGANPFSAMYAEEKELGQVIYTSAAFVVLIFLFFNALILYQGIFPETPV